MNNLPYENVPTINKEVEKQRSMNSIKEYEQKVNPNAIKVIAGFVSLAGAIIGIIMGFTQAEYSDEFNAGIMLLVWLISDILAVFIFTGASILEQLLKINETLRIWNRTGIISNNELSGINDSYDRNTAWKCTNCGRINATYVGTCGCGQQRDNK